MSPSEPCSEPHARPPVTYGITLFHHSRPAQPTRPRNVRPDRRFDEQFGGAPPQITVFVEPRISAQDSSASRPRTNRLICQLYPTVPPTNPPLTSYPALNPSELQPFQEICAWPAPPY